MARFARDCMRCMREAVNKLELTLGPDTADLELRIGIHSGPITAGKWRGMTQYFVSHGEEGSHIFCCHTLNANDRSAAGRSKSIPTLW